ncbi:MAG: flippase [Nitrospira sp.]|nr:flippase [Nitrospira sp.]
MTTPLTVTESSHPTHDLRRLFTGGSTVLFASAIGNGINYTFGIFLARSLGANEFGLYALALTLFNILTLTAVFGMDTCVTKFVSRYLEEGQPAKVRETVTVSTCIAMGLGFIAATGLGLLAGPLATDIYGKPELANSLLFFAAAIPFATLTTVLVSTLQAYQTVRYTILIKYIWEPIAKFVFAGILLGAGFQLLGVLASIVVTLAVSAILSLRAVYGLIFDKSDAPLAWSAREMKTLLAYGVPLALSNVFGIVAPRSDVLILGYWVNAQEVGIYLAAFQTAAIISLVLGAFETGLAPIISRAWTQQDLTRMTDSYQAVSRLSITISLPIFCCLLLLASDILKVFGPEFARGAAALMILATGQLFHNSTGSANTVLLMSGHSRLVMTNTVVMGVALLATTALLIPLWGITGAAIAASMTFILTNVVRIIQVWRLHHIQPYTWSLMKPIAAAATATGILITIQNSTVSIPGFFLGLTLGALYLIGLLLLGIHQQDRLVIQSLLTMVKSLIKTE